MAAAALRAFSQTPTLRNLGGAPAGFPIRSKIKPFDFIEHCHLPGLGVAESSMQTKDPNMPFKLEMITALGVPAFQ